MHIRNARSDMVCNHPDNAANICRANNQQKVEYKLLRDHFFGQVKFICKPGNKTG